MLNSGKRTTETSIKRRNNWWTIKAHTKHWTCLRPADGEGGRHYGRQFLIRRRLHLNTPPPRYAKISRTCSTDPGGGCKQMEIPWSRAGLHHSNEQVPFLCSICTISPEPLGGAKLIFTRNIALKSKSHQPTAPNMGFSLISPRQVYRDRTTFSFLRELRADLDGCFLPCSTEFLAID